MQLEAKVRTRYLKPRKPWKQIDLRDAVGKLSLEATKPDEPAFLRHLWWAMSGYEKKSCRVTVRIGSKKVAEYSHGGAERRQGGAK